MHGTLPWTRVFLGPRVTRLDQEVDGHTMHFLEHKRAIDRRVLTQGAGDLGEFKLIGGRAKLDAAMRLDEQTVGDDLRTGMAVFFDDLIQNAGTRSVHRRSNQGLWLIPVVFYFEDPAVGAGCPRRSNANPRMVDLQIAGNFLMR